MWWKMGQQIRHCHSEWLSMLPRASQCQMGCKQWPIWASPTLFTFFHLCRQGEDVLLHMLIQRESMVSSCQMRVQSKSMITVKSSIWSEETDLVSKLLGLFGSRNPKSSAKTGGLITLPWHHCQLCSHKLKAEKRDLIYKISSLPNTWEVCKRSEVNCLQVCTQHSTLR